MSVQEHMRCAHSRAMAVGGRAVDREQERVAMPADLLASAIDGLPDLTAATLIGADLVDPAPDGLTLGEARRQARHQASRALRLCQRALEVDARDRGYDWRPWVDHTIHDTLIALDRAAGPDLGLLHGFGHAGALARSLGDATRALTYDRMALPEALSAAQTSALLIVVAVEADEGRARRRRGLPPLDGPSGDNSPPTRDGAAEPAANGAGTQATAVDGTASAAGAAARPLIETETAARGADPSGRPSAEAGTVGSAGATSRPGAGTGLHPGAG